MQVHTLAVGLATRLLELDELRGQRLLSVNVSNVIGIPHQVRVTVDDHSGLSFQALPQIHVLIRLTGVFSPFGGSVQFMAIAAQELWIELHPQARTVRYDDVAVFIGDPPGNDIILVEQGAGWVGWILQAGHGSAQVSLAGRTN